MTEEESPAKRGDAAWKEQREAISRRNAEAHKRAQGAKRDRADVQAAAQRADLNREAEQLRDLNTRISKQRGRGVR
jgi:hypothetical protein